jgi:alginate O-acetyltransferase complex protein AlgI
MLFNSLPFLYIFLPVAYLVFWHLKGKSQRYIWLTLTGYVFYSFWSVPFCTLMAFSTAVSYLAGVLMLKHENNARRRRLALIIPIVVDLTLLGYFKYANLALSTAGSIASLIGVPIEIQHLNIILPIGISFYTFHTITYIVDSYRRVIVPTTNFFEFAAYVSFFPQLIAGPIVRFRQVEADLENIDRSDASSLLNRAWSFFAIGMVKKVVVADTIASIIDPALQNYSSLSTLGAWACMLGYTYELYFDFSGYSDMAVGLGLLFGVRLPQNFNSPYKAADIADFWRRWHISLSSILRDYLYIPLGGSRSGVWNANRNLMITMLLGGLWHGANWTFVVWGAYHGALLVIHRTFQSEWGRLPVILRQAGTFVAVVVGWVLFRSETFDMALALYGKMFSLQSGADFVGGTVLAIALLTAGVLAHTGPNTFEMTHDYAPRTAAAITAAFAVCLFIIYGARPSPFLYFQF